MADDPQIDLFDDEAPAHEPEPAPVVEDEPSEDVVVTDTDPVDEEDIVKIEDVDDSHEIVDPPSDAETFQVPNPDPSPEPLVIAREAQAESAEAEEQAFALVRDPQFYPEESEIAVSFPDSGLEPNADEHGRIVLSGDPVQVTRHAANLASGLPFVIVEVSA